ncbi:MAG: DNA/RNA non-specific endonuclease [Anaerolineales bacterium]|jgi:endonuclease G
MAAKKVSIESLKAFIRREGPRLLEQSNVTSVGIGYKVKDGKPTKELSIQFTVAKKVGLEQLESIGAEKLPDSFEIDGVKVPTDILERKYEHSAREVRLEAKLEAASSRKSAVDPLVPGVSIANVNETAGTLGCVVYDARTGASYVLSNWHVLNGPGGHIGDSIVQPGPYDDNRVDRNVVGRLVRSYLGVAGDGAIASVDNRRLSPDILDLNLAVDRVGEPELGDRVIKSGRTTAVTYGIVNRIHTMVSIPYGGVVEQIGCFEIGPDPDHPAQNHQITMGGDSGSAWLATDKDAATGMMLGLHFAGETGDAPDHAMACYAASIFEKLGVLPQPPAQVVLEPAALGYSPTFIGESVPLPVPASSEVSADLLDVGGNTVFDYTHFSLAMSRSHRFARWVSWNIDGGSLKSLSRKGISFKKDPHLPSDAQVGDELYSHNPLDRGHVARRADLVWGTMDEAKKANIDSFFFTNITPQHEDFNRSNAHGIWGELENAIFADVEVEDLRISVVGGPIFSDNDPLYRGVHLPRQFWKIIYYREAGSPDVTSRAYVLTQADLLNQLEALELPQFSVFEVSVSHVSGMTGLALFAGVAPETLRPPQPRAEVVSPVGAIRHIASVSEIVA